MRVITGKYRGRRLVSPDSARPTLQRVKQSLFSTIQDKIAGANCLDLFAGSGALGIECISRQAKFVDFVEIDAGAIKCLSCNLKGIDPSLFCVTNSDYKLALRKFAGENKKFDLVFLDPPYKSGVYASVIDLLNRYDLLADGALVVAEMDLQNDLQFKENQCIIYKIKEYGSLKIVIFKKEVLI